MIKHRKKGSGRTKNSFSFVPITLEALNAKFADKTTKILASRKQMAMFGFENLVTAKVGDLNAAVAGQTTEAASSVIVQEL